MPTSNILTSRIIGAPFRLLLSATLLACAAANAQNSSAFAGIGQPAGNRDAVLSPETVTVEVSEVDLLFTARGRHDKPVTSLTQDDITVLDNGQEPRGIIQFQSKTDLPLRLGLLVDTSDSIGSNFRLEQHSAASFLKHTLDQDKDKAFVLAFNHQLRIMQELTSDVPSLTRAVEQMRLGGETALYDAVRYGCEKLLQGNTQTPRRVLVVLTDGEDNHSGNTLSDAIQAALRSNVVIIVLNTSIVWEPSSPVTKRLRALADSTGGRMLHLNSDYGLRNAFHQLESELRTEYFLAYKPPELSDRRSYRKIELTTTVKGVHLFYRHGYYTSTLSRTAQGCDMNSSCFEALGPH